MILILRKKLIFMIPLLLAFLISQNQSIDIYVPQIIALISIIILFISIYFHQPPTILIVFLVSLIILSSGAISSPLFFLNYFLLFTFAFQNSPLTNLVYSLSIIIVYSYSLNSSNSVIELLSLLFITPLTWFISQQREIQNIDEKVISQDETDFMLWISLRLKKSLRDIINLSNQHQVKKIAKNLLRDSEKLSQGIDQNSDEI